MGARVIVICPGCGTAYREDAGGIASGRTVRCGRCGGTFRLQGSPGFHVHSVPVEARVARSASGSESPQVSRAAPPAAFLRDLQESKRSSTMPVGMDDPRLAGSLERAADVSGEAGKSTPWTYWVFAEDAANAAADPNFPGAREADPAPACEATAPSAAGTGRRCDALGPGMSTGVPPAGDEEAAASSPMPDTTGRGVATPRAGLAVGLVAGSGLGAVASWLLGWSLPSSAVWGGACGAIVGWCWTRWKTRRA